MYEDYGRRTYYVVSSPPHPHSQPYGRGGGERLRSIRMLIFLKGHHFILLNEQMIAQGKLCPQDQGRTTLPHPFCFNYSVLCGVTYDIVEELIPNT